MPETLLEFLRGATMVATLGVALFFLRFWKDSDDRLFAFFASAFFLIALSQPVVSFMGKNGEFEALCYWIRLIAFLLIIMGIVTKNTEKTEK